MINITDIESAEKRLAGHIVGTPLIESEWINGRLGGRVLFKAECLQKTGSFKIRGASNKILSLNAAQKINGVVAYSSGNHAQGVAAAASAVGIKAKIVIPRDAPELKIANTRAYGAEVILYDRESESREQIATQIAARDGSTIIPPYNDEYVIAGQGTVGLELNRQLDAIDTIPDLLLCPCGGGGLMAGVATALRQRFADIELYAVEPEDFDDTRRSLVANRRVSNEAGKTSICDAIVTPTPGELTFEINRSLLDGGFAVSDASVIEAVIEAFTRLKLVVEPGAAVGLAALMSGAYALRGKTAVVVLSGGNMDLTTLRSFFK